MADKKKAIVFLSINYRVENSTFLQSIPSILRQEELHSIIITDTNIPESFTNSDFITYYSLKETSVAEPQNNITSFKSKQIGIFHNLRSYLYRIKKEFQWLGKLQKTSEQILQLVNDLDFQIIKVCAIEIDSLLIGNLLCKELKTELVFSSMELSFWEQKRPWIVNVYLKWVVSRNLESVRCISIQDNDRKKALYRHTKTKRPFIILPVGILGPSNRVKSEYLRQKFNIPLEKKIILYAGSIRSWARVLEIAQIATSWHEDFCLVINGWIGDLEYFKQINELANTNTNIYLSTDPVLWDELDTLVSSADIGLAIYHSTDENEQSISSSSNKFAIYAKSGVPLITNLTPSTDLLFKETPWGEGILIIEELESKVKRIINDLEMYKEKSFEAFEKYYNLSSLSKEFINELKR